MRNFLKKLYYLLPHPKTLTPLKKALLICYYIFAFLCLLGNLAVGIFVLSIGYLVQAWSELAYYARKNKELTKTINTFIASTLFLAISIIALSHLPDQTQTTNQTLQNPKTTTVVESAYQSKTAKNTNVNTATVSQVAYNIPTKASNNPKTTTQPATVTNTKNNAKVENQVVKLEKVLVTHVVDGDTIDVKFSDGRTERVRFIGVNAPESTKEVEPYGVQATLFTEENLLDKYIFLEKDVSERDKYGRLLRYIWLEPPAKLNEAEIRQKLFNAIMLLQGYAQVATFPPDVKYVDYFTKFQKEAREKNEGLWSIVSLEQESTNTSDEGYIGNSNSKKFHYPWCKWAQKISSFNRVYFKTREEAINAGYVPCKVCNP